MRCEAFPQEKHIKLHFWLRSKISFDCVVWLLKHDEKNVMHIDRPGNCETVRKHVAVTWETKSVTKNVIWAKSLRKRRDCSFQHFTSRVPVPIKWVEDLCIWMQEMPMCISNAIWGKNTYKYKNFASRTKPLVCEEGEILPPSVKLCENHALERCERRMKTFTFHARSIASLTKGVWKSQSYPRSAKAERRQMIGYDWRGFVLN